MILYEGILGESAAAEGNFLLPSGFLRGVKCVTAFFCSASKIALYAILRVVQAPKCDFGAFCVHYT